MYKEKTCALCLAIFKPTSPKQKYCENCRLEGSKITARVRDLKRNRKKNNYVLQTKTCKSCGIEFSTYYTKKEYCGAEECEKVRLYIKNQKIHLKRSKEALKTKGLKYYKENKERCCLKKAEQYREKHPNAKSYISGKPYRLEYDYVKEYVESKGYKFLSEEYVNNRVEILLECEKEHRWLTTFHNFKDGGARCFYCYINNNYTSKPEKRVREFFENNYSELTVVYNDRKQIYPKELDFYFPDHKIAVEICGLHWHSERSGKKDRDYHYNKTIKCFEKGIRLITVFEDELINSFDVVMSYIVQALSITKEKIFAIKCKLKEISFHEANSFFGKFHIQGKSSILKAWGLYYNDVLVCACGVGNFVRKYSVCIDSIELKRFCTLPYIVVVGGVSKLFSAVRKYTKEQGFKEIKLCCDMRYTDIFNPAYELLNFKLETEVKYSPYYIKGAVRYRHTSLIKTSEELLTDEAESDLKKEQNYDRIWDCGYRTYSYIV